MSQQGPDPFPLEGVDLDHPSVARVYDWLLGGTANWAIDREFGSKVVTAFPLLKSVALSNRLFLHRAVRHLVRRGVRQFIDIGSGIPTVGNTHQIADEVAPDSRVVYADYEPVAVAHSRLLLEQHGDRRRHAIIQADMRDPGRLWDGVRETDVIDFSQPVAVLLVAVLHIQQLDGDGIEVGPESVARYRELLPSGSYLAVSQVTDEGVPAGVDQQLADLKQMYDASTSPVIWRRQGEIRALMGDFELLEPGMTWTPLWHPEDSGANAPVITFETPEESVIWCGVGRKP
ncbi:methyltransferase [Amycolatopsis sp. K13G38]|uniref:Methyltransferase n=1 Tax=Amycolatopsis acididurans TaxID=2724524 RepID=A0ABX1JIQ2_9PSEU|nr:SAM-dependent methyltransferase [Amycolatopsis acididurans]NKQ58315.1 methyltransferase [Amycolatopsis acididurans]